LFECQIEPSMFGGKIIADIIQHAAENHDFEGESKIYYKPTQKGAVQVEDNAQGYEWDISDWDFFTSDL